MNCPVCKAQIEDEALKCTACNADLEAYKHLENIDKQQKTRKILIWILSILLIVAAIFLIMTYVGTEKEDMESIKQENATLQKENQQLQSQNEALHQQIEDVKAKESETPAQESSVNESTSMEASVVHVVKEGDTLWEIAKAYFGDYYMYQKIAEDNSIQDPKKLKIGQKLDIHK